MSLLIIGTVAFDAIETQFGKTDKIVGGAATYASLSASYFYPNIQMVSIIGDDFPQNYLEKFQQVGIDISGVEIIKGEKSFFWSGKYHDDMNGRDTLVTDLNVLSSFNPQLPASFRHPDYVLLGNIDPNLQLQVLKQLSNKPKLVVLDTMNFWMDVALEKLMEVIQKVDLLTINDEEARQLTGEHSLVKAASAIFEMGPQFLIIKKGEHGALLFDKNSIFFAPALPLEQVYDPTGAGDTFAGGFLGSLAKSGDASIGQMRKSVIHGSAMASFCVQEFGTENLLSLKDEDIAQRVEAFKNLVNF